MRLFHWTQEHAVFQPEFDAEHRELFRLGEELHRAVQAGAAPQTMQETTRLLIAEVDAHFTHEERLMRSHHYSGYAWHKRQHDDVRSRLQTLTAAPSDLLRYLSTWFRDHTAVADRMMAAAMRNASRQGDIGKVRTYSASAAAPVIARQRRARS
jgi:hemerythrin-like metal-binding protein